MADQVAPPPRVDARVDLSAVIPIYRAEDCLHELYRRLRAAIFQWQLYREGPKRDKAFDAGYSKVLDAARAIPSRPIFLVTGRPGRYSYILAYWYGTLQGMHASEFSRLPANERPPASSLVIDDISGEECAQCQLILLQPPYVLYRHAAF